MQNTISNQRLQTADTQKTSGAVTRSRKNDEQAVLTDPFMQIIMSMLTQYADESANGEGAENLQGILGGQESENAQLFALLGSLPGLNLLGADGKDTATLLNADNSAVSDQMTGNAYWQLFQSILQSASESGDAPNADAILKMLGDESFSMQGLKTDPILQVESTSQNAQTIAELLASKLSGGDGQTTNARQLIEELQKLSESGNLSVKSAEVGAESGETETRSAKDLFTMAAQRAKELMAKQPKAETEGADKAPVEALPQTKTLTPFELRFKAAGQTAEIPLNEQISAGIKENLSLGKSEFTVKLNPESLGEITVKLVEESGRTTLTITTASAQTAKLINSDMDALKAAVSPMNVQVNEAVTNSGASAQSGMQQFDMASQQFAFQQQSSRQFAASQGFLRMTQESSESGESYTEGISAAAMSAVSSGRLDAYI